MMIMIISPMFVVVQRTELLNCMLDIFMAISRAMSPNIIIVPMTSDEQRHRLLCAYLISPLQERHFKEL
jgi:hypothetical protein